MKRAYYLLIILSICTFTQCKNQDYPTVNIFEPQAIWSTDQLSDSSYISDVRAFFWDTLKNELYFSDYNRDQFFKTNTNFHLIETIGQKGRGPGELSGASHLFICQDTIYIYNDAKICFEVFYNTKHIRSINLPKTINRVNSDINFCKEKNFLYFSIPNFESKTSIVKLNVDNGELEAFGEFILHDTPRSSAIRNYRHLFLVSFPAEMNRIVSVCQAYHRVEVYSLQGDLISSLNYEDLDHVKNHAQYISSQTLPENSYNSIAAHAYLNGRNLYILIWNHEKNMEDFGCNTIIHMLLENDQFSVKRIIKLPGYAHSAICFNSDTLFTSNSEYGISRFQLQ